MRKIILISFVCLFGIFSLGLDFAEARRNQDWPCTNPPPADRGAGIPTQACPAANHCETAGTCDLEGEDLCSYEEFTTCTEYNAGGILQRTETWACDPASGCDPGSCVDNAECATKAKNKCLIYSCVGEGNCQRVGRKTCDDGDALTANICDPATGNCSNPPIAIPDPIGMSIWDRVEPSWHKDLILARSKNNIGQSVGEIFKIAVTNDEADDPGIQEWLNFRWNDYYRQKVANALVGAAISTTVDKLSNGNEMRYGKGEVKFEIHFTIKFHKKKPPK